MPKNCAKRSCLTLQSLKKIACKLNKDERYNKKKINIKKYNRVNKEKLVKLIQKKINCDANLDFCILKKEDEFYNELFDVLKPKGPINKNEWLSSINITDVMTQYEKKHKDFNFLGPYPIDFLQLFNELSSLNVKKLCKNKKKIGIIWNTDVSSGPGIHWISLFLNMNDRTICFFDSVGTSPPLPIINLIKEIINQSIKMGCPLKLVINKKQYQKDNSSCGVWALWHIVSRLKGKSCNYIYNGKNFNDKLMYKKRKEYFRKN